MPSHLSIGQRMSRAKSPAVRLEVAQSWAKEWFNEQESLLRKLKSAIVAGDNAEALFYWRQLDAVNKKRHQSLPGLFNKMANIDSQNEL
ncbi:MAG: hypothetical protein ABF820_11795 [Sporolactobacillus sp.]